MNCYAKNFNNQVVCSNKLQVLYKSTSGIYATHNTDSTY